MTLVRGGSEGNSVSGVSLHVLVLVDHVVVVLQHGGDGFLILGNLEPTEEPSLQQEDKSATWWTESALTSQ